VIQLWNPALKNGTTRTLVLNLQMLKSGEEALSHRHMAGAVRFIVKGHGARLIVEGESFEIGEGDFATTPSWTWHDHENNSGQTMLWLDGLDAPLVRLLETDFHEPDPRKKQPVTKPEGYAASTLGALRPSWVRQNSIQPPAFAYKWEATEKALSRLGEQPGDPYDGIVLEYANPLTGGPTLPTMSCQIHMLRAGEKTKSHRHTSSAIYYVHRGSGVSYVGDQRYEWEQGDSFVAPLWYFHHHQNTSKDPAIFFVMNDKPLMDAIGHYREETQA
jgi:gentisate 1,2-dioxygenase